jgi:transportin-1
VLASSKARASPASSSTTTTTPSGVNVSNGIERVVNPVRTSSTVSDADDDETLDDDEDDVDEDDVEGEWTVRKCSAAALDALATAYPDEVLSLLLPRLQERLMDAGRWEQRESGVLALGAIAQGCYAGIAPHMPTLFPYLVNSLEDRHHRVRVISCWTLSRYSRWALDGEMNDSTKLQHTLKALLDRMLDCNKTVQRSACSAFATFEEQAGPLLVTYIKPILQAIASASERYQQNNMVVLFDAISTLADAVGGELASQQDHVNSLMQPLINRWNAVTSDTDPALVPLFECLAYVFRALGTASQSFAVPIFTRAIRVVEAIYAAEAAGVTDETTHIDLLTSSFDLMCSLTEALGATIDPLMSRPAAHGGASLLQLLFVAMKDRRQEVRQSAFALVGEFARAGLPSLIPVLKEYVLAVCDALSPDYMSVANNATWALGEMVMMAGCLPSEIPIDREAIKRPLVENALASLIRVINIPQLNKSLLENTAITLGRMGLILPEDVAPRLDSFASPTLSALRNIRDDPDKEHAFSGMNALIRLNPTAILSCFVYYADAVASWLYVNPKLEAEFRSILTGFKTSLGDQWPILYATFPRTLQVCLQGRFGL